MIFNDAMKIGSLLKQLSKKAALSRIAVFITWAEIEETHEGPVIKEQKTEVSEFINEKLDLANFIGNGTRIWAVGDSIKKLDGDDIG